MNFEEYLSSKKIDAAAFLKAEPGVFQEWKTEFLQMHPNSFTVQKLNLINPIRRKYQLPHESKPSPEPATPSVEGAPKAARPMIRPKPKMN